MSARLHDLAVAWSAWAAPLLFQFTLLAIALLVADRFFLRRVWPRLRLALHGVVLLGLVLPPLLPPALAPSRVLPALRFEVVEGAERALDPGALVARLAPRQGTLTLAFALWLTIALLLAAGVLLRHRRARARVVAEDLGASSRLRAHVASLARRLRLRRVPRVIVLPAASSPAVLGVWRPLLLLPAALAQRAESGERGEGSEELEHALLHELLHVKRGDLVAAFVARFIAIAWWFHPLAWLVARRATALRELACDDDVARLLRERAPAYRATLLERARRLVAEPASPGLPALPGALGFFAMPGTLLARLEWLARPRRVRPRLERAVTWLAASLLLLAVLPAARADRGIHGRGAPPSPLAIDSKLHQAATDVVHAALRGERPPGCLRLRNAVHLLSRNQS